MKPKEFWIRKDSCFVWTDKDFDMLKYDQDKIEYKNKLVCVVEKSAYDKAIEALKFYAETNVQVYDEENADSDCEQNIQYPWRYESGKLARETLKKLSEQC